MVSRLRNVQNNCILAWLVFLKKLHHGIFTLQTSCWIATALTLCGLLEMQFYFLGRICLCGIFVFVFVIFLYLCLWYFCIFCKLFAELRLTGIWKRNVLSTLHFAKVFSKSISMCTMNNEQWGICVQCTI